jgi:hypothetical protein
MPSLVKVRSFLGVAEAELARIRLAMDGISAQVSNAELVIWFWHYSNATGGVKLFVSESDAPQAAIILSPRPVPPLFQPPEWNCPKCQADVDGLWSYCWSCGTSKHGEEDPDFHTWYRESGGSLAGKSFTEATAAIFAVIYIVAFLAFKNYPVILINWIVVITALWALIYRSSSLHRVPMCNAADLESKPEDFSPGHYDPSRDEFNPADDTAYKLWKAAIFSLGRWSFIFFAFALWLWYKTNKISSSLSVIGVRRYYYSSLFLILNLMLYVWIISWMLKKNLLYLVYEIFLT